MKIKSFEVHGLFGQDNLPPLMFNDDLNILSGRNGAGKTTILKLMWYLISGNIETAIIEIPFNSAKLVTDKYELTVKINLESAEVYTSTLILKEYEHATKREVREFNKSNFNRYSIIPFIGNSYFFPTFRIIEGGFGTDKYSIRNEILRSKLKKNSENEKYTFDLINDFDLISKGISNREHNFITSVSSSSINKLIVSKYAEVMSHVNPLHNLREHVTKDIIKNIDFSSLDSLEKNQDMLKNITFQLEEINQQIEKFNKPINRLKSTLRFFIENYQIKFGEKVTFEKLIKEDKDADFINNLKKIQETGYESIFKFKNKINTAFDINCLSAGEKQILNFISYNAFYDNTIFFIDEPEISLHADWQRILFRMLMKQNPTNQFIISTHSPFIYSKYPEKEVCIDPELDRGNVED